MRGDGIPPPAGLPQRRRVASARVEARLTRWTIDLAGKTNRAKREPAPEGDGYVITLVHPAATNTGELLILNAQDIAGEPATVLELPRRVPAGFHGNFVPA